MAGDQATNSGGEKKSGHTKFTPREIGIIMLNLKKARIKQLLADDLHQSPGKLKAAIRKLVAKKPLIRRWMKVAGIDVAQLERMIK